MAKTDFHTDSSQSQTYDRELVPRRMMTAVFVLICSVLVLVSYARLTERPLVGVPPVSPVTQTVEIFLQSDTSGSVNVRDSQGNVMVDRGPNEGGFLSTIWRVVNRERIVHRVPLDGPVIVRMHENGRLSLYDPSTKETLELNGFGANNAKAFEKLLVN
ncbi:MAG: photosynthetic complex assembly protein PuhC [Pseudomonadota bacterium]